MKKSKKPSLVCNCPVCDSEKVEPIDIFEVYADRIIQPLHLIHNKIVIVCNNCGVFFKKTKGNGIL